MPKILIIDDDATSRRLYASLLTPCGYSILEARDGQEGLSIAQAENPDLVICDIVMPMINGYQFVQELRNLPQHQQTPVIFHSVNLMDEEARALGSACGISRFILKPFDSQQALATIQEALQTDPRQAPVALPPAAKRRDPIPLLLNAYFVKGKKLDASVQLASLVDVGIALAHAQQTPQVFEIAMTAARKLTDAKFAAAGILGESDSLETQTLALSGFDKTTAAQLRQGSFSPPFLREVLGLRQPWRIFNPPEESLAWLLPLPHPKVCSILAVPLESDRAYGWMMIAEKSDSQAFTDEDERMLQALASQTITSYQSAQRFRTIQEHAKDLEHQIEERKGAEHRFRMLLETSPTAILISNGTGRIEDVNAEALRMFGYAREELVGQMIEVLVPRRLQLAHEGHRADYAHDLRTRPMRTGTEMFGRRKDGTEFPAEIGLGPLATRDGILISSMIVDITARKKMEEQLRLSQRMEAIGKLAGGVAHDFNNLLAVILGCADVAVDALPQDHPVIHKLEMIRKAGTSAADLTRQLLAFGRQQLIQPRILDLKDTLRQTEALLHRLIGANIELKISLDPSLGTIKADPGQIEQILLNLSVNARDAMPEGGRLTIEASNVEMDESYREQHPAAVPGRYVMLAVTDTGCGMDRNTQLRIFDPFFTTKELGKGTGLGLVTVYGIVKQGGGYIWVYSEIAKGTVFKVYLPRTEQTAQPAKREDREEVCNGNETILLAEDSASLREMTGEYLGSVGYTVLESASGKDALQRAKDFAGTIRLLLTDVVMPEMSGPELAKQLTLQRPGIKIIFTSGYTDDAITRQGILDSTIAFIQKPYRPKELAKKIREVLHDAPGGLPALAPQSASATNDPATKTSR
jgi:PAS domain S-box-containing protein